MINFIVQLVFQQVPKTVIKPARRFLRQCEQQSTRPVSNYRYGSEAYLSLGVADKFLKEATTKAEGGDSEADPMRVIYLQCDFVCQSALLALILKAIPPGQHADIPDNCIGVARSTLDMHLSCMEGMRHCKDPLLVRKYVNW